VPHLLVAKPGFREHSIPTNAIVHFRAGRRGSGRSCGRLCDSATFAPLDPNAIVAPAGSA
jgi:hypothetical protein